jgi:hypothetical protein
MLGILLGAGFSKWALDLPLAGQLFDFKITPFGIREAIKTIRVTRTKENWDKENPNKPAKKFIADALTRHDINKELVLWYIVRRLSEPFIWIDRYTFGKRRHILMVDENRKCSYCGSNPRKRTIRTTQVSLELSRANTERYYRPDCFWFCIQSL